MTKNGTPLSSSEAVARNKPSPKITKTPATTTTADKRNLAWKSSNVGISLLHKMGGWETGQAIGKRQRSREQPSTDGEGMRATMRPEGLGLGASSSSTAAAAHHSCIPHVDDFSSVLASLQQTHGSSSTADEPTSRPVTTTKKNKKKKNTASSSTSEAEPQKQKEAKKKTPNSKKKSSLLLLPRNKMTHAKVRAAKFQPKSEHDMQCIFGIKSAPTNTTASSL